MEETVIQDNIVVMVRIRPQTEEEALHKKCLHLDLEHKNSIFMETKPLQKVFTFDHVADETSTQQEIFNKICKPIAESFLQGYNGCIFAYGQTGAGKTYTMQGDSLLTVNRGLIPRVFEFIYKRIEEKKLNPNVEFLMKCSYLEIYNENIIDLLNPASGKLQLREDIKHGVYVDDLTKGVSYNQQDCLDLLSKGLLNRHVSQTDKNKKSSRSHSVFTLHVESKELTAGKITLIRSSRFHLVDLAGSERQKSTNSVGERLKEGCNINRSLSILGNVINGLVEKNNGKQRYIHYRDSKLTFLLKDSLGGNSRTSIIANIPSTCLCIQETLSTLKFANRAKQIFNKAQINEDSQGDVESLKRKIKLLQKEVTVIQSEYRAYQQEFDRPSQISIGQLDENDCLSDLVKNSRSMKNIEKEVINVLSEIKKDIEQEKVEKINQQQYLLVISLQKEKLKRCKQQLQIKINEQNLKKFYKSDRAHLKTLNTYLMNIVQNHYIISQQVDKINPDQIDKLTQLLLQNEKLIEKLQDDLQEITSEKSQNISAEKFNESVEECQQLLQTSEGSIILLQRQLCDQKSYTKAMEETYEKRISTMLEKFKVFQKDTTDLSQMETDMQKLQLQNIQLKEENQREHLKIEEHKRELTSKHKDIISLQNQVRVQITEKEVLQKQVKKLSKNPVKQNEFMDLKILQEKTEENLNTIKKELEECLIQKREVEDEFETISDSLQFYQQEVENSVKAISEKQEIIGKTVTEKKEIESKIQEIREESDKLLQEKDTVYQQLFQENQSLIDSKTSLELMVKQLTTDNEDLKERELQKEENISKLELKLEEINHEMEILRKQNENLKEEKDSYSIKIVELEGSIETLTNEKSDLQMKYNESLDLNKEKEYKNNKFKLKISQLQESLSQKKDDHEALACDMNEMSLKIDEIQAENGQIMKNKSLIEEKLLDKIKLIEEQNQEKIESQEEFMKIKKDKTDMELQNQQNATKIQELQSSQQINEEQTIQHLSQIKQLSTQIQELEKEKQQSDSSKIELVKQLNDENITKSQYQEQIKSLEQEKDNYSIKIVELEGSIETLTNEKSDLQIKMTAFEEQLNSRKQATKVQIQTQEELKQQISNLKIINSNTEEQLSEQSIINKEIQLESNDMKDELSTLKEENQNIQIKFSNSVKDLSQLQNQIIEIQQASTDQNEIQESKIQEIREESDKLLQEKDTVYQQIFQENQSLIDSKTSLELMVKQLTTDNEYQKEQISNCEQNVEKIKEKAVMLKNKNRDLMKEVEELGNDNNNSNKQKEEMLIKIEKLKEECQQMKEEGQKMLKLKEEELVKANFDMKEIIEKNNIKKKTNKSLQDEILTMKEETENILRNQDISTATLNEKIENSRQELKIKSEESVKLAQNCLELKDEIQQLKQQVNFFKILVADLQDKEKSFCQEEDEILNEEKKKLNSNAKEYDMKIISLEQAMQAKEEYLQTLEIKSNDFSLQNQELTVQNEKLTLNFNKIETQLDEKKEIIKKDENIIKNLQANIKTSIIENDKLHSKNKKIILSLSSKIDLSILNNAQIHEKDSTKIQNLEEVIISVQKERNIQQMISENKVQELKQKISIIEQEKDDLKKILNGNSLKSEESLLKFKQKLSLEHQRELELQQQKFQGEISAIGKDLEELNGYNEQIIHEKEQLQSELNSREQDQQKELQIKKQQQQIQTYAKTITQQEEKLRRIVKKLAGMVQKREQSKKINVTQQEKIWNQQIKIDELKEEQKKLEEDQQSQISQLLFEKADILDRNTTLKGKNERIIKENGKFQTKIAEINKEKFILLKEIDSISLKLPSQNEESMLLNRVKTDNLGLQEEKQHLKKRLSKTLRQRDKLQKVIKLLLSNFSSCKLKVDELAKRLNSQETSTSVDKKHNHKLKTQLQRKQIENKVLINGLQKLSNALNNNNKNESVYDESYGIESLVDNVQKIVKKIVDNPRETVAITKSRKTDASLKNFENQYSFLQDKYSVPKQQKRVKGRYSHAIQKRRILDEFDANFENFQPNSQIQPPTKLENPTRNRQKVPQSLNTSYQKRDKQMKIPEMKASRNQFKRYRSNSKRGMKLKQQDKENQNIEKLYSYI